jgi:DNA-binding MarR family transcriptional regulator
MASAVPITVWCTSSTATRAFGSPISSKITKQSLGRVLKQLVDTGFIEQRPGPVDRRQRLLYPTEAGRALSIRLLDPQLRRIGDALKELSPAERTGAERFLRQMIDRDEREKVARLIGR